MKTRIGRRYALYLPKAVVEAVGLREGEKVQLRVEGNTIVLESLQDPIQLALTGKKFASIKPEEVEAISLEKQRSQAESSS